MSGGHFDYGFYGIDNYEGQMEDPELELLRQDFTLLLKSLEWYRSGDTCRKTYREDVRKFKKKWLVGGEERTERLKEIIEKEVGKCERNLLNMIGVRADEPEGEDDD